MIFFRRIFFGVLLFIIFIGRKILVILFVHMLLLIALNHLMIHKFRCFRIHWIIRPIIVIHQRIIDILFNIWVAEYPLRFAQSCLIPIDLHLFFVLLCCWIRPEILQVLIRNVHRLHFPVFMSISFCRLQIIHVITISRGLPIQIMGALTLDRFIISSLIVDQRSGEVVCGILRSQLLIGTADCFVYHLILPGMYVFMQHCLQGHVI